MLECAIDVWGKPGPVILASAVAGTANQNRSHRDPQGGEDSRRSKAAADHLRRRRAGCFRGSHRVVGDAASAGAGIPARPRRARRPQSIQCHAAARPRPVGRSRRCARRRHAHADPVPAVGHQSRRQDHPHRCRSERAQPPAQAGGGAHRRQQADPAKPARRIAGAQRQAAVAQGRNGRASGGVAQAL